MDFEFLVMIAVVAYLIGSVPTAYLVGRAKGIDIFQIGSGNMGAGNTARALGIQWGALVWLIDGIKGVVALLVARELAAPDQQSAALIAAAIAVVVGHNWSIFATLMTGRIRGGKGAATASGTWLLLVPPLMIAVVLLIWAALVYITRYMSLAVLTAVGAISLGIVALVVLNARDPVYIGYVLVTVMIFFRHRTNIRAILAGTERRFGERAKTS